MQNYTYGSMLYFVVVVFFSSQNTVYVALGGLELAMQTDQAGLELIAICMPLFPAAVFFYGL